MRPLCKVKCAHSPLQINFSIQTSQIWNKEVISNGCDGQMCGILDDEGGIPHSNKAFIAGKTQRFRTGLANAHVTVGHDMCLRR